MDAATMRRCDDAMLYTNTRMCAYLPPRSPSQTLHATPTAPDGFLGAIETSGGFGDPFLFGLLPVLMAWRQRYGPEAAEGNKEMVEPLVPGGKAGLVGLGGWVAVWMRGRDGSYMGWREGSTYIYNLFTYLLTIT